MNKDTRNAIERTTQRARNVLEEDFASQLAATFDVLRTGQIAAKPGVHLSARQVFQREKIVAAIEHKRATGMTAALAVGDYIRDAAFTTLNRFVALKMMEARELLQECITKGDQSAGYREFGGMAPGITLLPDKTGYRLYIECVFDELSTEMKLLFDRRDPASLLWPRRQTFETLLGLLNAIDLAGVWNEDETIGWFYQFFNSSDERRQMREESPVPRNSRELAVRNQFFTPRYVVQFLADNTLGRIWFQMHGGKTILAERCAYLIHDEDLAAPRPKKDPRDLKVLDPACGSGHFLLYVFDLLLSIYEEAWHDPTSPPRTAGSTLHEDYSDLAALHRDVPALIVQHNLHGVDIDPRAAQIAALALWLRAQRAFKEFGLAPIQRKTISRTHIVVGEPMPGDVAMVDGFAASIDPPLLRELFKKMVEEMRLAGEMGILLRVEESIATELKRGREQFIAREKEVRRGYLPGFEPVHMQADLDLSGIDDAHFFHEAEARIVESLRCFAESASGGAGVRRRLFAGDSAQGIALIDLLRTRFDVVLMNPPFGEPTPLSSDYLVHTWPSAKNDLLCAFVVRGALLLNTQGYLGAITSRSFVAGRDTLGFRKTLIEGRESRLRLFLDLGSGVLDSALVQTAAYTIGAHTNGEIMYLDLRVDGVRNSSEVQQGQWRLFHSQSFAAIPGVPLAFNLDDGQAVVLGSDTQRLEPTFSRVTQGLTTEDDPRFVRAWWEVEPSSIGTKWHLLAKGGEYSWFTGNVHLVVNRDQEGRELAAYAEINSGNVSATRRSSAYYGRPAVTFSRRSQKGFSARRLRAGVVFSDKSGVIIPKDDPERWLRCLPLFFASQNQLSVISAQATFGSYETGVIKSLPVPEEKWLQVEGRALTIYRLCDLMDQTDETSIIFDWPARVEDEIETIPDKVQAEAVTAISSIGSLPALDALELNRRAMRARAEELVDGQRWLSYAVGVVMGRWKFDRTITTERAHAGLDPFVALSVEVPIRPIAAILVEDPGHAKDIVRAVESILETLTRQVPMNLRVWFQREFFSYHLAMYTKSKRKAPIYWQIATPSASYSIWLHAHRLTKDSFFEIQNDFLVQKLAYEARKHADMVRDAGTSPNSVQRKEIAEREALVEELRAMFDEVKRIAPLWKPDLNDGIPLTMAPLWRLVPQHRPWQKELKMTWDTLCAGEYDWAHLAMHLWPERVVPKCANDRSLAIAHGLEAIFWMTDEDGKWKRRPTPTIPIEQLVRERSSLAVKAALKSLLEAPGTITFARGRLRRSARMAADGGNV